MLIHHNILALSRTTWTPAGLGFAFVTSCKSIYQPHRSISIYRMASSRWDVITKCHESSLENSRNENTLLQLFPRLVDDLNYLHLHEEEKNTFLSCPANRDQLLVLLSFFAKVVEGCDSDLRGKLILSKLSTALIPIFLESGDIHVYTLASKCLCLCLVVKEAQAENPYWFKDILVPCVSRLRSGTQTGRILDLFRYVFSKRFATNQSAAESICDIEKLRLWALQELLRLWRPLAEDIISRIINDTNVNDQEDPVLFSFLSLWSKLIKAHQKYLEGEDLSLPDDDKFAPLQKTTSILTDVLCKHDVIPVIFDKICDVLNRTLLYGFGNDQFQYGTGQARGFQVDLAADVLRGVQRGLLERVPLNCGLRHFGGVHQEDGSEGGGGDLAKVSTEAKCPGKVGINLRSFRKITLLVTKACTLLTRSPDYAGVSLSAVELVLDNLWSWGREAFAQDTSSHWMYLVFGEQDDMLVEMMLCFLDIYTSIKWKPSGLSQVENACQMGMSPHILFLHFLHHTSFDHTLLLDLLTSPETCFLLYLVRYLHHAQSTWSELSDLCLTWKIPILNEEGEQDTQRPRSDALVLISTPQPTVSGDKVHPGENPSPKLSYEEPQKSQLTPTDNPTIEPCPYKEKSIDEGSTIDSTAIISSLKIVDYSDDSLSSDSDTEELPVGGCYDPTDAKENMSDPHATIYAKDSSTETANSAKSDLPSSPAGSLTSLTSVTSELEMTSEGMETDVEDGALDRMMSVLIRLRLVIERLDDKGLFPYNASALRRILCQTEALYEGEDP